MVCPLQGHTKHFPSAGLCQRNIALAALLARPGRLSPISLALIERAEQPVVEQRDRRKIAAGEAGMMIVVHPRHRAEIFEWKRFAFPQIVIVQVYLCENYEGKDDRH